MTEQHKQSSAASEYELLPCPFCGSQTADIGATQEEENQEFSVICPSCGASCSLSCETEERAVELWNRRTGDAAQPVAWTNEHQLGYLKDPEWASVPMAMWGKPNEAARIPLYASQPSPAATVTDGSIQEGDVLSYTMDDGVGNVTAHVRPHSGSSAATEDVRWAVNYLLEQIAAKFEAWETFDLFRSEAASTVRSFKHDLSSVSPQAVEVTPADNLIAQIETRFPNWRSYRDLLDCIDCTLHQLRGIN